MRRVCYVSGSRADFGLMEHTLKLALRDSRLAVSVCVTGQHLCEEFGYTVNGIEASDIPISARVPVRLDGSTGGAMARAIACELLGMTEVFERERPDLVLVLGDRGEMLAGALAAIHLNIPVVHIHGGELSGTVDEPVRHAISKLAHYHFVATPGARERLVRMGENPGHVFVTGAPGLDGLREAPQGNRAELAAAYGLDSKRPIAILIFHAVLQEQAKAGDQANEILQALAGEGIQVLCLMPNSDGGGMEVRRVIEQYASHPDFCIVEHLGRKEYLAWLSVGDVLVGNSSSGIIEAASFGVPVVNVGNRQRGRERSGNVVDVEPDSAVICEALMGALDHGRGQWKNVYGDGCSGERIVELLATVPLAQELLLKTNAY